MEFQILGPLDVVKGGRPVPVGGARQRALLAMLLARANEVVSSDRLIEELWAGHPPEGSANALQAAVSRLRRALGAGQQDAGPPVQILTRPPGYVLEADPEAIDAQRFQRLTIQGREALAADDPLRASVLLNEALGLWRGPPLADFTYEPFAQAEIARLEELRLAATEKRIEADLALGRHAEVTGELEALVARHPFRERLRAQVMVALYRSGRQAEALEAFREGRQTLVQELGIDPGPELRALEAAILRQDPSLLPHASPSPSPPSGPLVPLKPPAEPAMAAEVRKTVTVVFADLAGSTALGERLDPEALREVMARYFEVASACIRRHGGSVEKFIGDAVMAVFGIPVLHEDDALRALRAAWDLKEELAELSAELEGGWGVGLEVRIGVNTGEVVAGQASPGQALVTGDAVNTAARLEQAAGPGEILVGEPTYRLVAGAVEAEPLPGLTLKGKGHTVAARRVTTVLPEAAPFPRRVDAPLVGRRAELAQLHQAFDRVVQERTAYLFTVLGAAGIGKTRLALEFASEVQPGAVVLIGRCLPYGEGITYWPLREILQHAFGEDVPGGIEALLEGEGHAVLITDRVMGAIGLAETQGPVEEIRWAVRRILEALARRHPLLIVLEDLHWAEPTFLDLVDHLTDLITDAPLLLVCLARPELLEDRPTWGGGKRNATTLELEPLVPEDARVLLGNLAPSPERPLQASERIMAIAEGNPLFLEQLAVALAESMPGEGEMPFPPTIQALLAARLERLGPGERGILERAAVVGKEFSESEVAELLPEVARPPAARHLEQLVRKRYVRPAPSTFVPGSGYRFRHILVQEAVYRGIPKRMRADLHERFANLMLQRESGRLPEYDEIMGYHLEQAHRYLTELGPADDRADPLARRAAELLGSAGLRASAREDYHGAENLLTRSTQLWPPQDVPGRARPLLKLADVLLLSGEFARADAVLAEITDAARQSGDRAIEARGEVRRIRLQAQVDPTMGAEEGLRRAERAAEVLAEVGDEAGLAEAWVQVAFLRQALGSDREGEMALSRARGFARSSRDPWLDSRVLGPLLFGPLPWTGTGGRTASEEADRAREALSGGTERRSEEAYAQLSLALHLAMQGDFQAAREHIAAGSAILEDLGLKVDLASAVALVRAQIEMLAGDPAAAELALRPGIDVLQALGSTGLLSTRAAFMARILYEQGRHDEALEFAELAERTGAEGDMETQLRFRGVRAQVIARRGASKEAERLAHEVVDMAEDTDWLNYQGDVFMDLAEVLRLTGRRKEAADALRKAAERYERKGNVVSAARARDLLESMPPLDESSSS